MVIKQRQEIFDEIELERQRQIELQLDENLSDEFNNQHDWVAYICVYAGKAVLTKKRRESFKFRENMIKVAALATAAIEAFDKDWC